MRLGLSFECIFNLLKSVRQSFDRARIGDRECTDHTIAARGNHKFRSRYRQHRRSNQWQLEALRDRLGEAFVACSRFG